MRPCNDVARQALSRRQRRARPASVIAALDPRVERGERTARAVIKTLQGAHRCAQAPPACRRRRGVGASRCRRRLAPLGPAEYGAADKQMRAAWVAADDSPGPWQPKGTPPAARPAPALFGEGRVWIAGGTSSAGDFDSVVTTAVGDPLGPWIPMARRRRCRGGEPCGAVHRLKGLGVRGRRQGGPDQRVAGKLGSPCGGVGVCAETGPPCRRLAQSVSCGRVGP